MHPILGPAAVRNRRGERRPGILSRRKGPADSLTRSRADLDAAKDELQRKQREFAAELAAKQAECGALVSKSITDQGNRFAAELGAKQKEVEAATVAWHNEKLQLEARIAGAEQEWEVRKKALLDEQAGYQAQLRACQASSDPAAAKQIQDREQNLLRTVQYMQRGTGWLLSQRRGLFTSATNQKTWCPGCAASGTASWTVASPTPTG